MSGVLVCVVGPSGAGKDTLIAGAAARLADDTRFAFPRRVVTRPTSAFEDHDSVAPAEFEVLSRQGAFSLCWEAHGLRYGIPIAAAERVRGGAVAVCNLSRAAIAEARLRFAAVRVVLVTAPAEVLHQRLMSRRREDAETLLQRLARDVPTGGAGVDLTITNAGPVDVAVDALEGFLRECADLDAAADSPAAPA